MLTLVVVHHSYAVRCKNGKKPGLHISNVCFRCHYADGVTIRDLVARLRQDDVKHRVAGSLVRLLRVVLSLAGKPHDVKSMRVFFDKHGIDWDAAGIDGASLVDMSREERRRYRKDSDDDEDEESQEPPKKSTRRT